MTGLTLRRLDDVANMELGGPLSGRTSLRELANRAGEHLMAGHTWQWAEGRSVVLRPRAETVLVAATWTEATRTLTEIGAFVDYSFLSADTFKLTDGTGATIGTYEVESRTDDDEIVLRTSIGAAADAETDIAGSLPNDQIALPSDFSVQGITGYWVHDGLVGSVEFVSGNEMLALRSYGPAGSVAGWRAMLRHVRGVNGGQPVPRLELWPRSGDAEEALVILYRGGWREPATDAEVFSIPQWVNELYLEVFKTVLMGTEEPQVGSVSARLLELRRGVLWADAMNMDSTMQTDFGAYGGTWMDDGSKLSRFDFPAAVPLPPT